MEISYLEEKNFANEKKFQFHRLLNIEFGFQSGKIQLKKLLKFPRFFSAQSQNKTRLLKESKKIFRMNSTKKKGVHYRKKIHCRNSCTR